MYSFRRTLQIVFWITIVTLAFSFFMRDRFPASNSILNELEREPIQTETTTPPFQIEKGQVPYTITPLYNYDLVGFVVSEHRTDTWFDYYHKQWNDSFNVKDLCVIWGDNAMSGIYNNMKFKSGSWTCYYSSSDYATWNAFSHNALSNNHLLTASPEIEKLLLSIRRGDQVRIKGYLAEYKDNEGFKRGSSITRNDTGNGACETVYVSELQLLRQANPIWRSLFTFSLYLLILITILRIIFFFIFASRVVRKVQM